MGRHCFVPKCKTGYKANSIVHRPKCSTFKAPSDTALLEKWKKAINRKDKELSSTDIVCELHFANHEVIKEWKAELEGHVIMRAPCRAKLHPNAVPSIFPGNLPINQKFERKTRRMKEPKRLVTTDDTKIADSCTGHTNPNYPEPNQASTDETEAKYSIEVTVTTYPDDIKPTLTSSKLQNIQNLCSHVSEVTLPSESWSFQRCISEYAKYISFQACNFTKRHLAIITKQVIITENLGVKIYFLQNDMTAELNPRDLSTTEDVSRILSLVHETKYCIGGPSSFSYNDVFPMNAYVDLLDVWRHKLCGIIAGPGGQCVKCVNLENTLRAQVRRKLQKREVSDRLPLSPSKSVNCQSSPDTKACSWASTP